VRVDFGGGWTDTPPFSLERGGAVFNAALSPLPIWAEAEVIPQRRLVLESEDIGAAVDVATAADAAGYCQPNDPFALLKACLVLMGVLDPAVERPLDAGTGLRVRTGCRIPRGSGLGTSSILGAALLRALGEALGRPQEDAELSRQTLELEQLMTTGGGWQDQMGAIAPGAKLVSTEPGLEQRPLVQPLALAPSDRRTFEAHLVVAYTGHHRLAKNILREVVMRYLGRDPLAMQALYQLRAVAARLAQAAAALDLELFGTLVNQAWLLNKTLDPQTSYPAVERLFSALAPHVHGAKLVGAGGGGFLIAVTRRPHQQELVADLMARDREFAYGYVVPHELWDGGLQVVSR
jgi:fucokinase